MANAKNNSLWKKALTAVMVLSLWGCEMWTRATHCPQCPAPQPAPAKIIQLPAPKPLPPVIIEVPAPVPPLAPLRTCQWGTSTYTRIANLEPFPWAGKVYEFGQGCTLEKYGSVIELGHDGLGTLGRYVVPNGRWALDQGQCPPGALVLVPTALFEEVCAGLHVDGAGGKQKPPTDAEAADATKERVRRILRPEKN